MVSITVGCGEHITMTEKTSTDMPDIESREQGQRDLTVVGENRTAEEREQSQNALFADMDLSKDVMAALDKLKLTRPTTVQQLAIPILMAGRNLIAKAPTGTGKTFAFGIPLLEYLNMKERKVQNIILCPTRELALQICEELKSIGQYIKGFRVAAVIGGQDMNRQIQNLQKNPQIVVATPGRLLDLLNRRQIDLSNIYTVILDEADEMLSMGFIKDIRSIMDATPKDKQVALFSATLSREVMDISWEYIRDGAEIEVEPLAEDMPQIKQYLVSVPEKDKEKILLQIIEENELGRVMIFCNTKSKVERVTAALKKRGLQAEALHGDVPQRLRNRVMDGYRQGFFHILVATDVAARGIDVNDVEGVINYDVPSENEYYLHRIGRTGRARKQGVAFTLMAYTEKPRMEEILRYTRVQVDELEF